MSSATAIGVFGSIARMRRKQLALAVLEALGDHRAVQIEHDAVEPAFRDRVADDRRGACARRRRPRPGRSAARRRRSATRSRRPRARRDRDRRRARCRCRDSRDRRLAVKRAPARAKPRERRRHRREGVGLVRELHDEETHGDSGLSGSPNNGDEVEALRKLRLRWVCCRGAKNPGACERRTDEKEFSAGRMPPPTKWWGGLGWGAHPPRYR